MTVSGEAAAPAVPPPPVPAHGDLRRRPPGGRGVRPRPPAAPLGEPSERISVVTTALVLLASISLWVVFHMLVLSGVEQSRSQDQLYDTFRQQLASQTAPTGGVIPVGTPVALLSIPTIRVNQVVVEGTGGSDLAKGPGHRRDTVLPGQVGTAILYGRSATYGGPFRSITMLQAGDGIKVTTAQGEFVYRVDRVRRGGDPTPPARGELEGRLTLVTAEGQGIFSGVTPSTVVYVDATLQGEAAVGAGRGAGSVPAVEKALAADTSALPTLAIALQGLLIAVVATVWLRGKVPGRVVWIITVPVLASLAWVASDAAMRLLPNLL